MKIIYAADNRKSSRDSLIRFMETYGKFYEVRVAGYSKSLHNLNADWNLDALLDFTGKRHTIDYGTRNFALFAREIHRFKPHLIISDLEPYSSHIAIEQGIPLWQISPLLLNYGIASKKPSLAKTHSKLMIGNLRDYECLSYILRNSDKRLILSHLGDIDHPPSLKKGFDWVRPNIKIIKKDRLIASGINLSDLYFNELSKYIIDYQDKESIICSGFNQLYLKSNELNISEKVKFISQHLETFDIKKSKRF